ncbi:MAG: nicotinate-nucleotide adenylyltransferase [Pseudomonadota bacterium]
MDWTALPPHGPGQAIGLLGGSFNPAHAGHRHISLIALKRLKLDNIWWLVTPGNPLKDNDGLPPIDERIAQARRIANHPRIKVTGIEAQLGTRFTADTLTRLKRRAPSLHFVWLMGADNLAGFHRWDRWRGIAEALPIAVIDRPGYTQSALTATAADALVRFRIDESDAPLLARREAPAWVFLFGPRSQLSSTALRASSALMERENGVKSVYD